MTIKLADGRSELWQWDTGRKITFDDANIKQAHFQNHANGYGRTIDVDVEDGAAKIPDELLQADLPLTVYAYIGEESDGYTKVERVFTVKPRKRPAEYVFTPADQLTLRKIESIIGNLDDLTTTAKNNLVAAINEAAKTGSGGAGSIDLRTADGYIQYSNDGGATWENLIALADLKGEKGDTGATGPQGETGPQGPQGKTGPAGPQGKTGPAGQDGAPGKDGSPGKDGAPGADGAPGTPGTNGTDGKDGTTFTPSVSAAGDLSWTNDGGKANPAPVNLKGPPGADYTLTDADKTEIAAEVIAGGVEAQLGPVPLPAPSAAAVGQIVKIKAVDAAGKITETEAVELPSGGGSGDTWELINFIKIADDAEEAIGLTIDKDSSGKAFSLSRFRLIALSPIYTGETEIPNFCFASINGRKMASLQSEKPMAYTSLQMPSKTSPTAWVWAEGYLSGNGAWEFEYLVQGQATNSALLEDFNVVADVRAGGDRVKIGAATVSDRPKLYPITSVGFDQRPVYAGCMFWLYGTRI